MLEIIILVVGSGIIFFQSAGLFLAGLGICIIEGNAEVHMVKVALACISYFIDVIFHT